MCYYSSKMLQTLTLNSLNYSSNGCSAIAVVNLKVKIATGPLEKKYSTNKTPKNNKTKTKKYPIHKSLQILAEINTSAYKSPTTFIIFHKNYDYGAN